MSSLIRRRVDDPAEDAARLLLRLGVFLLFVASQLVPVFARQTIYILLPIGAALLFLGASLASEPGAARPLKRIAVSPAVIAAVFLVGWAGLSLMWTPFASGPSERFAKSAATLALVAIVCGVLPARTKTSNLNLLPIGVGVAALCLIGISLFTEARPQTAEDILDVSALGRVGVGLALLVWPAMGALAVRDRWPWALALAVCAAVACLVSSAPNALPALAVGAVVYAFSLGRVRRAAPVLAAVFVAIILLAPLLALAAHFLLDGRASGVLRPLAVWGSIVTRDGARTFTGHGYGAAIFALSSSRVECARRSRRFCLRVSPPPSPSALWGQPRNSFGGLLSPASTPSPSLSSSRGSFASVAHASR
jgi:hypothetical protein